MMRIQKSVFAAAAATAFGAGVADVADAKLTYRQYKAQQHSAFMSASGSAPSGRINENRVILKLKPGAMA